MKKQRGLTIRAVGLGALLIGIWLFTSSERAEASHETFANGDVFISLKAGQVEWRHPDGTLNKVLLTAVGGHAEGMGFDVSGNLYVAHWCGDGLCLTGNTVERFNKNGVLIGTFGIGYNLNPNSIVFDASGNAYVGQAASTQDVLKFDAVGTKQDSFNVLTEVGGSDWIDLAADGCTIFYTSRGPNILRYNACANAQLPNFNAAPLPDPNAWGLRILPDNGVLVANNSVIVRLDQAGNVIQTYDVPGEPELWLGLDVTSDGAFWVTNFGSANVYKIDLGTGQVLTSFSTGVGSGTIKAVAVFRAPTVVKFGGRMTGGGSIFTDDGTRVTHGFELRCDVNRPPHRLEINIHPASGGAGRKFHLETLSFAECTDDPSINPIPPPAPFDTYEGKGTGRYNGQSGATAEWIFTDAGEPGRDDRIKKLIIRDAGGNVVLFVPEPGKTLTYGNHQAHK